MSFERTCKFCKKGFNPNREWQKFCSSECQKEYWRQVYNERSAVNKRLEELEEKVGISK